MLAGVFQWWCDVLIHSSNPLGDLFVASAFWLNCNRIQLRFTLAIPYFTRLELLFFVLVSPQRGYISFWGCLVFGFFFPFVYLCYSLGLWLQFGAIGRNYHKLVACSFFFPLYCGFSSPKCSYCTSFFCEEASLWFAMQIRSPCSSWF